MYTNNCVLSVHAPELLNQSQHRLAQPSCSGGGGGGALFQALFEVDHAPEGHPVHEVYRNAVLLTHACCLILKALIKKALNVTC